MGGVATFTNCLFQDNYADVAGGLNSWGPYPVIIDNCTFVGNQSPAAYPCQLYNYTGSLDIRDSIIAFGVGGESMSEMGISLSHSNVFGNEGGDWVGSIAGQFGSNGNISEDPLFASGVEGGYYLSQTASGQSVNSPCVDAGDPQSPMIQGTTRTDGVNDSGIVDLGFHYSAGAVVVTGPHLVAGPGMGYDNPPNVRIIPPAQGAAAVNEFSAYGVPHYGVNVSCGDLDGDGLDEILTGAGPGAVFGPHVRGFEVDGAPLPGLSFLAYGTNKWGVNVAAGNIDDDEFDEIITGAGPGAVFGPHVRGWNYDGTGSTAAMASVSYFAYGTPKWGVNVTMGDLDGDGYDEIVTGAGPGAVYGPHVRGWNVDNGPVSPMGGVSFLAYRTNKFGVNVACGDIDGDGMDEIITGAGPSPVFGAHVRGWNCDGSAVTELAGLNFFAWPAEEARYGAKVFAGADLNGDGRDELVVGAGPDPAVATPVKVYRYDGAQVAQWFSLEAFPSLTHGVNVAAGRF